MMMLMMVVVVMMMMMMMMNCIPVHGIGLCCSTQYKILYQCLL